MTRREKRPPEPFAGFSSSSSSDSEDARYFARRRQPSSQNGVRRRATNPNLDFTTTSRRSSPGSSILRAPSLTMNRTHRIRKTARRKLNIEEYTSFDVTKTSDNYSSQESRHEQPQKSPKKTRKFPLSPLERSHTFSLNADSTSETPMNRPLSPLIQQSLTPSSQTDVPVGWRTKTQLFAMAQRYWGMAIQYRVMYSQTTLRDHNSGVVPPRQICPGELVVQSRFMCASGNGGGSTYSFLHWKLPGTLKTNARHKSIYENTRPKLWDETMNSTTMQETAHPIIVISSSLKDDDCQMVEKFLRQAEPGTTPAQFYAKETETIHAGRERPIAEIAKHQDDVLGSHKEAGIHEDVGEDSLPVVELGAHYDTHRILSIQGMEPATSQANSGKGDLNLQQAEPSTSCEKMSTDEFPNRQAEDIVAEEAAVGMNKHARGQLGLAVELGANANETPSDQGREPSNNQAHGSQEELLVRQTEPAVSLAQDYSEETRVLHSEALKPLDEIVNQQSKGDEINKGSGVKRNDRGQFHTAVEHGADSNQVTRVQDLELANNQATGGIGGILRRQPEPATNPVPLDTEETESIHSVLDITDNIAAHQAEDVVASEAPGKNTHVSGQVGTVVEQEANSNQVPSVQGLEASNSPASIGKGNEPSITPIQLCTKVTEEISWGQEILNTSDEIIADVVAHDEAGKNGHGGGNNSLEVELGADFNEISRITGLDTEKGKGGASQALDARADVTSSDDESGVKTSRRGMRRSSFPNHPKRSTKKHYGGMRTRHHRKVLFQVGEGDSECPQFFGLIEGIAADAMEARGNINPDASHEYIRDIFLNGCVERLPEQGRLMELPWEVKHGSWTAKIVETSTRASVGLLRDKIENLKNVRILLRHENSMKLGPLQCVEMGEQLSSTPTGPLEGLHIRTEGAGPSRGDSLEEVTISMIKVSSNRLETLVAQGMLSEDDMERQSQNPKNTDKFIGSISIVCFDGFTSSSDAALSAHQISSKILQSCRNSLIDSEIQDQKYPDILRELLPIHADNGSKPLARERGDDHECVGISFLCKIALVEDYALIVAQDANDRIVAVDVVFDSSAISGSSSAHQDKTLKPWNQLTLEMLIQHTDQMKGTAEATNLRVHKPDLNNHIPMEEAI